ncbi:MAG TPA: prolipoprotein diacylglyceryl transferase family protein, partial [Blastocatellia bacterium]|nr:prolipoprotein diacylglyceryl transferase family protein [Blastocatellia bacterium]
TYALLYSVARFTVEFWRDDPRGSVWGLSTSQFISAVMFPIALVLMLYYRRRSQSRTLKNAPHVAPQAT